MLVQTFFIVVPRCIMELLNHVFNDHYDDDTHALFSKYINLIDFSFVCNLYFLIKKKRLIRQEYRATMASIPLLGKMENNEIQLFFFFLVKTMKYNYASVSNII